VNDLGLADVERDKHEYHVDRRQDAEDPDEFPECGCVELLQRCVQAIALIGEDDIQPDAGHCQQQ
jgi:hypothetical protein